MRRFALALLACAAAACFWGRPKPRDAALENPIRVEANADGSLLVDGKAATWDDLETAARSALDARPRRRGGRPAATVIVEPGSPSDTTSRLLVTLRAAGVKEFKLGDSR